MTDYRPLRFIGEPIEPIFDEAPLLEKKPGCPDGFVWQGKTFRVIQMLSEWFDHSRRGRAARNMQPQHAEVAERRGSWGAGRYYFRLHVRGPVGRHAENRYFEIYYDRAPKGSDQRKGAWFLVNELEIEE